MHALYPPIEPYDRGRLDVGDGHSLYWECCGNPRGFPAIVLHGGPGSGASATARRYFDPDHFRVLLFDQRNCGRSTPHASNPEIDLTENALDRLIEDVEGFRRMLAAERVMLLGGSWGSTLALAYAIRHPDRVAGMVLNAVATTTAEEIEWITRGVGRFFPQAHQSFLAGLPEEARDGNLPAAYNNLLMHPDPNVHQPAADHWCAWEDAILHTVPGYRSLSRWSDQRFRLCFARLVTHYWRNAAGLGPYALIDGAASVLQHTPAILVHGQLDLGSPLATAWRLHKAWATSELRIVSAAGHDSSDPGMAETIVGAIQDMRARLRG